MCCPQALYFKKKSWFSFKNGASLCFYLNYCTLQILYKLQLSTVTEVWLCPTRPTAMLGILPLLFLPEILWFLFSSSIPASNVHFTLTHHLTFTSHKMLFSSLSVLPSSELYLGVIGENMSTVLTAKSLDSVSIRFIGCYKAYHNKLCYSGLLLMWFNKYDVMGCNSVHTVYKLHGCVGLWYILGALAMLPERK